MSESFFVSYSRADGAEFAIRLADELPSVPLWIDKHEVRPGKGWGVQLSEAIQTCRGILFIMTADSVRSNSRCTDELGIGLKYKKPIIPLRFDPNVDPPLELTSLQYLDFTASFDTGLDELRAHLAWMDSPKGQLQALKDRLMDAERDLSRAKPDKQARIREDMDELQRQIAHQQEILDHPRAAEKRVETSIKRGLERARKPDKPVGEITHTKFINPPPLIAPACFQDRDEQTGAIVDFLKDDSLRLITVLGRGGIGKSAMVCRLLRALEGGQLPDDGGALPVNGIVYLNRLFRRINLPNLYAGLTKLLDDETVRHLEAIYKNGSGDTRAIVQALTDAFAQGRTVVLLDNFDDELEVETGRIKSAELEETLHALLELPPHGLKLILTTRVFPTGLMQIEPGRQRPLNINTGLEHPFAEAVLRAMDADGKVGLRDASDQLLGEARVRTLGNPLALEHLFGILATDRDTSLQEILDETRPYLPEQVIEVLVGKAFSRLDQLAQRVMLALAIYRYPVAPAAVDYLLQPFVPGIDSGPVLSRLVNMQFVRRDARRYFLHQVDRYYALSRIAEGKPTDRKAATPPLTHYALRHRAAEWFKLSRKPREAWKSLDDLAAHLSEFELRCEGEEYNTAAAVLREFAYDCLHLWGHYRLMAELHERLQGKITDPRLAQRSANDLGSAYYRMGQHQETMAWFEESLRLARKNNDRSNEGVALCSLGACVAEIGWTERAIGYYEQALVISREVEDRKGEMSELCNLAFGFKAIGDFSGAIAYLRQALEIAHEIKGRANEAEILRAEAEILSNLGDDLMGLGRSMEAQARLTEARSISERIGYRFIEAVAIVSRGELELSLGDWKAAVTVLEEAISIADEIGNPQAQNYARVVLAQADLYGGDLAEARSMAEVARKYDYRLDNHDALAVLGVIAFRLGDLSAAKEAFRAALQQADELLAMTPNRYRALETKGLAHCGLALCGEPDQLSAAKDAYRAARTATSDAGVVLRAVQLFDALASGDTGSVLAEVRPIVAGPQEPKSAP